MEFRDPLYPAMPAAMGEPSLPSREAEQELHRRLLDGDLTASADLAEAYYEALLAHLRQRNRRTIGDDLIADAVSQAWSNLCKRPGSFDGQHSLWGYLCMSAQGDLRNLLAQEGRRQARLPVKHVELALVAGKCAENDGAAREAELAELRQRVLPRVQAGLTAGELRCLELLLAGERKTSRYAEALGVAHLPAAEQKSLVTRVKGKLKRRLERAGRKHDDAP